MAEELRFASREEVLDAIDDALHAAEEIDESGIEVVYQPRNDEMGCTIILLGEVGTEAERQIAERILTDVLGLPDVDNRLHVAEAIREEAPLVGKPTREDTDLLGEAIEVIEEGVVDEEFGYIPPDRPIPEANTEEDLRHTPHRFEEETRPGEASESEPESWEKERQHPGKE